MRGGLLYALLLFFIAAPLGCSPENPNQMIHKEPMVIDMGNFQYTVRGDLSENHTGNPMFYRAGTHVVVIFGSANDPAHLEMAYQETRENDTGGFLIKQEVEEGGFMMMYKHGEEQYWQRGGSIYISQSSTDTIVGRLDEILLACETEDTVKYVKILGHFTAY